MAGHDFSTQVLGATDTVIHTETLTELIAATDQMAAQAKFSLRILAHDTQPTLYSREPFIGLLTNFISQRSKVAKIQVLVADPRRALKESHYLVDLWHRFPSFVDFRELRAEYNQSREDFLLVDDIGLIRQPEPDSSVAVVTFRNLTTARERATWFKNTWAHSTTCHALRRLSL